MIIKAYINICTELQNLFSSWVFSYLLREMLGKFLSLVLIRVITCDCVKVLKMWCYSKMQSLSNEQKQVSFKLFLF